MPEDTTTQYKAVLFDLDGTLLDTIEDLTDSMNAGLAAAGMPARTVEECKLFIGDGVRNFALRAMPEGRRDERTVSSVLEVYRADYAERWADKTRPYDGVSEMLDALTTRGIPMAVLSNKPDDLVRNMVARLLPGWTFDAVWGERPGVPRKPDAAAALDIAGRIGLPPEQFVYLGDTNTDMQTANAAGMLAVGALWGFRTAEELRQHGAKTLISRPTDLLGLLNDPRPPLQGRASTT
jgi:phosphoglycolate phosphatase